jgi:hypothetical protein
MLTGPNGPARGPKQATSGPDRGISDNWSRLIRERPVFVNQALGFRKHSPKRRDLREYVNFSGVFEGEDGIVLAVIIDDRMIRH